MDVRLLVVESCPNEAPAMVTLRRALDEAGMPEVRVNLEVVATQAEAERLGFLGSPTVLINGRDPFAEPDQQPGLACRLYHSGDGVSGSVPLERLRAALMEAAG